MGIWVGGDDLPKVTFQMSDEAYELLRQEYLRRGAKHGEQSAIINEAVVAMLKGNMKEEK